jgi:hypothetical protein
MFAKYRDAGSCGYKMDELTDTYSVVCMCWSSYINYSKRTKELWLCNTNTSLSLFPCSLSVAEKQLPASIWKVDLRLSR